MMNASNEQILIEVNEYCTTLCCSCRGVRFRSWWEHNVVGSDLFFCILTAVGENSRSCGELTSPGVRASD